MPHGEGQEVNIGELLMPGNLRTTFVNHCLPRR
jgi:hypothetical protein